MFSHVVVGANDIPEAKRFYDAAMGALGHPPGQDAGDSVVYFAETGILLVTKPYDKGTATFGNGVTIGLHAPGADAVDAFHAKGIEAGGSDAGPPGPRDKIPNSYAAYLRDPTGNKIVAWCVKEG
jgi:catechol 2,3-dioxygenase-like lactoylglutathione lyase family enzyme